MASFRGRYLLRIALACTFIAVLVAPRAQADPAITPDSQSAPSAVVPETSTRNHIEKRRPKLDYSGNPVHLRIVLPPPGADEKRSMAESGGKQPLAVGFHRDVPSEFRGDVAPLLEWSSLPADIFVSAFAITSPGAESLRVGFRADLAPGGEIRFFGERPDQLFPVITREDYHLEGDELPILWSPTVRGATIGMEILLPTRKAVNAFSLRIDHVAHDFLTDGSLAPSPKALDCPDIHVDVQCRAAEIHDRLEDAVARIRFE